MVRDLCANARACYDECRKKTGGRDDDGRTAPRGGPIQDRDANVGKLRALEATVALCNDALAYLRRSIINDAHGKVSAFLSQQAKGEVSPPAPHNWPTFMWTSTTFGETLLV